MMVPFNKPYMTGKELWYIAQAHARGHLAGDGAFSKKCATWLQARTGAAKALLTRSCTSALDMSAILANVGVLRELAERAPPFAARGTSATARRSAPERHPGAASVPARPRSLLGRFHPWSSAPLSGRDRLTGRLSALYRGAEPGRSDLPRTSVPSNSAFVPSMLYAPLTILCAMSTPVLATDPTPSHFGTDRRSISSFLDDN